MTQATYDFCLRDAELSGLADDGTWQIGAPALAADLLDNRPGLKTQIMDTLARVTGQAIRVEFMTRIEMAQFEDLDLDLDPPADDEAEVGPSAAAQIIAAADWSRGFFKSGGAGYLQVPHHTTYFWAQLLGDAYRLLNILVAEDRRGLDNPANWWTQPQEYTFADLVSKLNRSHHRYISGDEIECHHSRMARQNDHALIAAEDCCGSSKYEYLRFKAHPVRSCLMCLHWRPGLLEILEQWDLVAIELKNLHSTQKSYKFTLQAWRMLPVLTPWQVQFLIPQLQEDYKRWLRAYGSKFNIPNLPFWEQIQEPNIVPLLPTHDQPEITHTFHKRKKLVEFRDRAIVNPRYIPPIPDQETDDDVEA